MALLSKLFPTKKRFGIGKKLISFTMIMLTLVLVMSVVSLWSVQRIGYDGETILNASSYNCMIHNLRLSFEKLIMPPHDYLIYSNPNEIYKFENNLKEIEKILSNVTEMTKIHKDEWDDGRERYLTSASQGIVNIESLANEILSTPDPLKKDVLFSNYVLFNLKSFYNPFVVKLRSQSLSCYKKAEKAY